MCNKESSLLPKRSEVFNNNYHVNYGFQIKLPLYINIEELLFKIKLEDDQYYYLKTYSSNQEQVSCLAQFLSLQHFGYTHKLSPERIRQSPIHPTQILKNKDLKYQLKDVFEKINIDKPFSEPKFHIFIVNNPITEIATIRTIKKEKLNSKNVLIILHRRENTSLLDKYKKIKTTFPDVEIIDDYVALKKVFNFVNKLKKIIKFQKYEIYAHHYFAVFTYLLAWDDKCVSANLIEEGNLSSVDLWEKESLTLQSFSDNVKLCNDFDNCEENISRPLFDFFKSYLINKAYIVQVLDILKDNFDVTPEIFLKYLSKDALMNSKNNFLRDFLSSNNENLRDMYLLCFQRFYFWHPKMAISCKFYSLSKAFKKNFKYRKINNVSIEEIALQEKYKSQIDNPYILFLLPPCDTDITNLYGKCHQKPFYKELIKNYTMQNSYYLMHPASRNDKKQEEMVMNLPAIKELNVRNISTILSESPVTEILSSLFRYVIHYGSSLSLTLSQYKTNVVEHTLHEFK